MKLIICSLACLLTGCGLTAVNPATGTSPLDDGTKAAADHFVAVAVPQVIEGVKAGLSTPEEGQVDWSLIVNAVLGTALAGAGATAVSQRRKNGAPGNLGVQ